MGHPRVILEKGGENTPNDSEFWRGFRGRAKPLGRRIILPEATDPRVLSAASFLARTGVARPILVGNPDEITAAAARSGLSLNGALFDDLSAQEEKALADLLFEKKKDKGLSPEGAVALAKDPLYRGAALLQAGRGDGFAGGAVRSTADTVRALFACVGPAAGARTAFGAFFMECPHAPGGPRRLLLADSAVAPHPSQRILATVAVESAAFFKRFTGETPRVALLSFSTKGSAEDESVSLVREAVELVRKKAPDLAVDGEIQADAALIGHIAETKGVTDFSVAGRANVLIFPDLNAGNIAYKMLQHLGGARAVGPFLVGLAKPATDLSRGCTDEDIVDGAALVGLMSGGG